MNYTCRINITLPLEMLQKLDQLAKDTPNSRSGLIQQILQQYIRENDKPAEDDPYKDSPDPALEKFLKENNYPLPPHFYDR